MIAASLPKPWPDEAVRFHLRWWSSRERMNDGARPRRPALVELTGWTDYAMRQIMADVGGWDDLRFDRSSTDVQPVVDRSSTGRRQDANGETPAIAEYSTDVQRAFNRSSTDVQPEIVLTRVGSQSTDHRPQDTGETETRAPVPVAVPVKPKRSASVAPEVAAVWSVYREEQAAIGSKRGESPPKGWGVAARVADPTIGADGMIAVIRWAHRSPHDRAKHLRDGGYLGDTLFRESKAPEYLPLALAWRDGTGPQPKPTGPGVLFGGSTFASKAEPAPTFPPPCRRWSNVLARLRLDGDAELVAAWLADSDLLDDRTVGVRAAHHVDWLTTAGGGLDPATEDMTAAIADALDVPRHRLRFVERPRVALEVPA